MKIKKSIKSTMIMATLGISSMFFINTSLAANTGKVNVETANLRETADSNSKILQLLPVNEEVQILEKNGEWYKVQAQGVTGYLREDIVTVNEEVTNETESQKEENTRNRRTTIHRK